MKRDERDLLEVLKFELEFLGKGGYGRSPREAWRPVFIFEDSPTCMNYDCKQDPAPCSDCVLMQLVPPELRAGKTPCRNIQLNGSGETLDSLYRYGDDHEIEETLKNWLRTTIAQLELQREAPQPDEHALPAEFASQVVRETPLCQSLHPKCANPPCPTAFHWTAGGKFFRFRPEQISPGVRTPATDLPIGLDGPHQYWLCERCSRVFTLVHQNEFGVVLKLRWMELLLNESRKEVPVSQRD